MKRNTIQDTFVCLVAHRRRQRDALRRLFAIASDGSYSPHHLFREGRWIRRVAAACAGRGHCSRCACFFLRRSKMSGRFIAAKFAAAAPLRPIGGIFMARQKPIAYAAARYFSADAQAQAECRLERLAGDDAGTPWPFQPQNTSWLIGFHEFSGITVLQLDRPAAKNALGKTLLQQLHDRIEELQFDGCVRFPWRYPFFHSLMHLS